MDNEPIESLGRLKQQLQKLPGIGARSAERLAFHILREPRAYAAELAQAVLDVKDKVTHCGTCFNLTERDPCGICADPRRDRAEIWVLEQPKDVMALEATGLVRGLYHVLLGHIAPLDGIGPEHLTIDALVNRVRVGGVREIVLALNPTLEGDGTALHIQSMLSDIGVLITRPARGLAVGSQIEYASMGMLESAIRGRTPA
jgi:recombination protein RecR